METQKTFLIHLGVVLLLWNTLGLAKPTAQTTSGNDALYKKVRATLKGRGDHIVRKVQRLGDKTIALEAFIGTDMDLALAPEILPKFSNYRNWLLKGINNRPSGSKYYVQFEDIKAPPGNPSQLAVNFNLDLPLFKLRGVQRFTARAYWQGDAYVMQARGVRSKKSVIVSSDLDLTIFRAEQPGRVWAHLKADVKVREWLLYAALPERVLNREVSERFRIILKNYLAEEDRLYRQIKSSQSPIKRMGASAPPSSAPPRK